MKTGNAKHQHPGDNAEHSDPLIDEVRENRRALVEAFGNDLDRLAKHLREVQTQYEQRTGPFAGLPRELNQELFPQMNKPIPDPATEDIRQVRAGRGRKRAAGRN